MPSRNMARYCLAMSSADSQTAALVPVGRDPHGVADEAVDEAPVEVGAEHALLDAPVQQRQPHLLEPAPGVEEVAEPLARRQVLGLVLVEHDSRAVLVDRAERLDDDGRQGVARVEPGVQDAVVGGPHVVQEGRQDLVGHRFLGVEVVVEAAAEDAGGVGDLPDGGGGVALGGEHLGGRGEQLGPPPRAGGGGAFGVAPSWTHRRGSYGCWEETETTSPVMYDE